jgi:hypothetical protein
VVTEDDPRRAPDDVQDHDQHRSQAALRRQGERGDAEDREGRCQPNEDRGAAGDRRRSPEVDRQDRRTPEHQDQVQEARDEGPGDDSQEADGGAGGDSGQSQLPDPLELVLVTVLHRGYADDAEQQLRGDDVADLDGVADGRELREAGREHIEDGGTDGYQAVVSN